MAIAASGEASDKIDLYLAKAAPFAQPILWHLREVVHKAVPDVEEAIKWSMPFFLYRGVILANMAAFKAHCSFGVWQEKTGPVKETVEPRGEGMGNFGKLTSLADLPGDKELKAILKEAARKIASGERTKNWERPVKKVAAADVVVPEALAAALAQDKAVAAKFAAMSGSCRKEYCQWIGEAKREETRTKRVATAMEWIGEGKARNWKYENC